ncbi:MAG: PAS domain-containing protein, partial [Spirochaetales bacterium]|nr:PAS domain-containing protein [Spirochaetales bacterium]
MQLQQYFVGRTALVAVAPFAVVFLGATLIVANIISREAIDQHAFLAAMLAAETKAHLDAAAGVIETMGAHAAIGLIDGSDDAEFFRRYGEGVIASNPVFSGLWLIDGEDGTVLSTVPSSIDATGHDFSQAPVFTRARRDGVTWSDIGLNPFFHGVVISVSIMVDDLVIAGWFEPSTLLGIVRSLEWGEGIFAFVCDSEGRPLIHPDPERVAQRYSLLAIEAVAVARGGSPHVSTVEDGLGETVYAAHPVGTAGWIVGVAQSSRDLFHFIPWLLTAGFSSFFVAALLILLGATHASNRVRVQLDALTVGTEAIAAGRYNTVLETQQFSQLESLRASIAAMQRAVRERERQLEETNILMRLVIDTTPMRIYWKDRTLRYLGGNRAFAEDARLSNVDDIEGSTDFDMPWREQADRYRRHDLSIMESGVPEIDFEERKADADGTTIWCNSSKVPLRNAEGEIVGILGIYQDVTQRRSIEKQLRELNRDLERRVEERTAELRRTLHNLSEAQTQIVYSEKLSVLGRLSAGIAHELNTPLGAIVSSIGTLVDFFDSQFENIQECLEHLSPDERRRFFALYNLAARKAGYIDSGVGRKARKALTRHLENIGTANAREVAENLAELHLVDLPMTHPDLLQDQGIEESLALVNAMAVPYRMVGIIAEATKRSTEVVGALRSYLRHEPAGETRPVNIEEDIDSVLTLLHNKIKRGVRVVRHYGGAWVEGVSSELSLVWINLITNGAQAMKYHGTLTIHTGTENGRVTVRVTDTGIGISEDIRDKIFEPFFTTRPHGVGMGIGLDICRRTVEKYKGSIKFESVS